MHRPSAAAERQEAAAGPAETAGRRPVRRRRSPPARWPARTVRTTDTGVAGRSADDQHPVVLLHTNMGEIVLRLDAAKRLRTVYNFMSYASNGHYDQTIFHQVDAGYAVLGGSYSIDLAERPGRYPIPNEASNGLKKEARHDRHGPVAGLDHTATCEFFINLVDNPQLDHQGDDPAKYGYCVFGEVIGGLSVLDKISKVKVQDTKQFQKIPVDTVMLQYVRRVVY